MKTLVIGVYANEKLIKKLNNLSHNEGKLSIAAIKYSRLIGEGFKYNIGKNSTNLFLVPIGMYPKCKVLFWKTREAEGNYYIPFINLLIIKQISISIYVFYFILKWYIINKNEKKVIVFNFLYLPFLIAVAPLKLLNNLIVLSFVPDLPEYEFSYSNNRFSIKRILIPLYITLSKRLALINDFFIYGTKYMKTHFRDKPYLIIEGFTDSSLPASEYDFITNKKAIMYAGALFEKFGIRMLLDAFYEIKGDYELWLFGNGDMEEEIIKSTYKDSRIKYWGNRSNEEILEFEKKAKLLINPRFSNNEFTKYSFPSKLMEYMASGTPVLTTKLPGIPEDYNDKMFYILEETLIGFKESILLYLNKPAKELYEFGRHTQTYVLVEKNNIKLIADLINRLNKISF